MSEEYVMCVNSCRQFGGRVKERCFFGPVVDLATPSGMGNQRDLATLPSIQGTVNLF